MEEKYLLNRLQEGDEKAFTVLFRYYYKDLVLFGGTFIPDRVICEDIVQSIFLKLWNDRTSLIIQTSLKSYLLRSVRNSCLDEIRHRHIIHEHESHTLQNNVLYDIDTENYILYSDLRRHLNNALDKLPSEYREAFELNRFDGLKYREIAERLQVSERTIEVRIGKAIHLLRKYLKDFIVLLLLLDIH